MGRGRALEDDVDEASRDNDDFAGGFAFEKGEDLLIVASEVFEGSGIDIVRDVHFGAEFPIDLDDDGDGFIDNKGGIVGGPRFIGEGVCMTEKVPYLFGDVGTDGGEKQGESFDQIERESVVLVASVGEFHEGGDGGVEFEGFDIFADFFDGFVEELLEFGRGVGVVGVVLEGAFFDKEPPDTGEKAEDALHPLVTPRFVLIEGTHKHLVSAHGVGTVVCDHIVGVHDVVAGLGHLFDLGVEGFVSVAGEPLAVFFGGFFGGKVLACLVLVAIGEDHALVKELLERLFGGDEAAIEEDFVPKARIEEVKDGVFSAADVEVDRHPIAFFFGGKGEFGVVGVEITEVIPTRASPLGHGVGFAFGGHACFGIDGLDPMLGACEGWASVFGGSIIFEFGQKQGQILRGHGFDGAVGKVQDRERFAPITLARKQPVTETIGDGSCSQALCFDPVDDAAFCIVDVESVDQIAVDVRAVAFVGSGGDIATLDDFEDGEVVCFGEFPVALIVCRDGHNRACAVVHQDIIGDVDGDRLPVDGVDGMRACPDACFLSAFVDAFAVRFVASGVDVLFDLIALVGLCDLGDQRMFGGEYAIRCAVEGIGAGGKDAEGVVGFGDTEVDFGPFGTTDPMALHGFDAFGPIEFVEVIEQALCVGGNLEHPLFHHAAFDRIACFDIDAIFDFFVGEDGALGRTPIDGDFGLISESLFVKLEEDPLGELVVVGIGGVDFAIPIIGKAKAFDLAAEGVDVFACGDSGMDACAHGVAFCGEAKGVPSHRMQDVETTHPFVSTKDICCGVAFGMADVQACARWIGEHIKDVVFGLGGIFDHAERFVGFPVVLPTLFDLVRSILLFCHNHAPLFSWVLFFEGSWSSQGRVWRAGVRSVCAEACPAKDSMGWTP